MAQIVETGIIGNSGSLRNLFEMLDHCAADKIFPQSIGEHQTKLVVPHFSGLLLFLLLPLHLIAEGIHHDGSRKDGAVLTTFGCLQKVVAVFALQLLQPA